MESEESFDPAEYSLSVAPFISRTAPPLDLKSLDQKLLAATSPRFPSPENLRTPTPSDQLTPGFDDPVVIRDSENENRETLEHQGCPPCCPFSIEYPYRRDLGEFESIVSWWKSVSENVIWAQLSDWERFCNWRKGRRPQRFTEPELQAYLNRLCERRRQFGLEGDVSLEAAIEDQSRLQTWMEFQDYHHRFQPNIQKSNGCQDIIKGRKALLDWIEEQRKVMVTKKPLAHLLRNNSVELRCGKMKRH
ncbi:hypothetical protein IWZ00DRAFT_71749 [Phyllosticta capitalensis]